MEDKLKKSDVEAKLYTSYSRKCVHISHVSLVIQAYFRCGIVKLLPEQEKRLIQTSESALSKKLGLGKKS